MFGAHLAVDHAIAAFGEQPREMGERLFHKIELGELHIVPAWVGAPLITAGGVPIPPGEGNAYGVGSVFVAGRALDGSARVVVCIDDLPAEERAELYQRLGVVKRVTNGYALLFYTESNALVVINRTDAP